MVVQGGTAWYGNKKNVCVYNYFLSDSPSSLRSPAKIKIACGHGGGIHESSVTALATETRFLIRRGSGASIWIWVLKWGRLGKISWEIIATCQLVPMLEEEMLGSYCVGWSLHTDWIYFIDFEGA